MTVWGQVLYHLHLVDNASIGQSRLVEPINPQGEEAKPKEFSSRRYRKVFVMPSIDLIEAQTGMYMYNG